MKQKQDRQKGQILILFVFGLVALLGFTALALDGGMVYADRRYDQSVADAAALAGAQAAEEVFNDNTAVYQDFVCAANLGHLNNGRGRYEVMQEAMVAAIAAAQTRAAANNFPITDGLFGASPDPENQVTIDCIGPKNSSELSQPGLRYLDIKVTVSSNTKTSFAHIFFGRDTIRNTVNSVTRLFGPTDLSMGYAIVALNDGDCNGQDPGMVFSGDSTTLIEGGGIYSNSCITSNGGITVDIDDGGAYYVATPPSGTWDGNGSSGSFLPTPQLNQTPFPARPLPDPDCSSLEERTVNTSTKYLLAGKYSNGISINTEGDWTMQQGLYCIYGNMTVNGGSLHSEGYGVTLYFQPASNGQPSKLDIGGNATVVLRATSKEDEYMYGLLFYMPPDNAGEIKIVGTSDSYYEGTIYAPTGDIAIGGSQTTSPTYNTTIIGMDVVVDGRSDLNIDNNSALKVIIPSSADQHK